MALTRDILLDMFEYKDGNLFNKYTRGPRAVKGCQVGSPSGPQGHLNVQFQGTKYYIHRIVYTMLMGDIPKGMLVDHINRNNLDNRIENLRLVTRAGNNRNTIVGKGYSKKGSGYQVRISTDEGRKTLGTFDCPEKARSVYLQAKVAHSHVQENTIWL